MVIHDLTEDTSALTEKRPAPYLDRFFANVIDFLILGPVISLFCGGVTNDLRWTMFTKTSDNVFSLVLQCLFITFALFVLYESMFVFFNGATPGHRFLYMRVVDNKGQRPGFLAILFRSVFKFQAILLGCVPFVEVVLRSDRSMFYDRLAQTYLVSLRQTKYDEIHPEFRKIILRWTNTSIILFFLAVGAIFYKTVTASQPQNLASTVKTKCTESLAHYLKHYLSKSREAENLNCAKELVEKSFDSGNSKAEINYLTQLVITPNEDLKESYKAKYCATRSEKILCQDTANLNFDKMKPDDEDVLNLLVALNAALPKNDHAQIFALLDVLYTYLDWNKNLELYYLTSYVFLNEQSSRGPAAEKDLKVGWDARKARFLKRMSVKP
ncbi:MAG: RDD family protein [Bdellovibrionaceae bacterium]|nr:RDD family protein [Pseudobdellovibrionaceae bacterium]